LQSGTGWGIVIAMTIDKYQHRHRPRNPTVHWETYEREHPGTLLPVLKERNRKLFDSLLRTDELHFVPRTKEELQPYESREVPVELKNLTMSLKDIFAILNSTAHTAGVSFDKEAGASLLSTNATIVRGSSRWFAHSRRGQPSTGIGYVYSPALAEEILIFHVGRRRGLDDATRGHWVQAIRAHFDPKATQG
jgi:hypothetical protein